VSIHIRRLGPEDLDSFVVHQLRLFAEMAGSGVPPFAPYPAGGHPDAEQIRRDRAECWQRATDVVGWERCFALVDGDTIVGHAELKGGRLVTELHRAMLGMGLERPYRRQGHGRRLLEACIAWARAERLAWVDLCVFGHNHAAQALYLGLGFVQTGAMSDRFRVDGRALEDIQMSLRLS
jgi:RimJ/RimL family protein N-acetyltransferase